MRYYINKNTNYNGGKTDLYRHTQKTLVEASVVSSLHTLNEVIMLGIFS